MILVADVLIMLTNIWISLEGQRDGEIFKLLGLNFEENLYNVYRNKNLLYNCYPRQLYSTLNLSSNSNDESIYINNLYIDKDIDLSQLLDKGYAYHLKVKNLSTNDEYYVLELNLLSGIIKYNNNPYNKDVYDREDYFDYSQTEEGIKSIERYNNNTIINNIKTLKLDNNLELNLYIRSEDKYTRVEESEMWINNIILK